LKLLDLQPPISGYNRFISSYLLLGKQVAIVDPGPQTAIPGLITALSELGVAPDKVDFVLLTHIHLDHAGGVGDLIEILPHATVLAHDRAVPHLINPENLWNASRKTLGGLALKYGQIKPVPGERVVAVSDGMELDLGNGIDLQICLTPGHAIHHLSLFEKLQSILIAGEAAGVCLNGAMRPATPPPFKLDVTLASIDKLIELNPDRICYGHFGCYSGGVTRLKTYREKLLAWHHVVSREITRGKKPEEILSILQQEDDDLAYLSRLDTDEYAREVSLLINTICGLGGLSMS
jgi:glyoxylase-like metal-dependent hydrolase (beta-lactamase superfamily II)